MIYRLVETRTVSPAVRSEPVSPPPVFDINRAVSARNFVESHYADQLNGLSALRIALILSLYNFFPNFTTNGFDNHVQRFLNRAPRLIATEMATADLSNPLPTIGFEVESPRKPYNAKTDFGRYDRFFASVGMPRNRIVLDASERGYNVPPFWEFSPPPSYSAEVQALILAELIKGGFIPHLTFSQNSEDIRKFLDNKFVALHINLGIPTMVAKEPPFAVRTREFELFAAIFALAFTSPQRLRSTTHAPLFREEKYAEPTKKNRIIPMRLEIKALEVRDEATYLLIRQIQLVGAALFAYLGDTRPLLKEQWSRLRSEVLLLFEKYHIDPSLLTTDRVYVADILQETDIASNLRTIIARTAREIKRVLG